jgi:hypothetical protein
MLEYKCYLSKYVHLKFGFESNFCNFSKSFIEVATSI